jgi:branched-chain amino acid aminotransferase
MGEFVYLNDHLELADQAVISVHDAGLLHGVGLFETVSSYHGRLFRLNDHLDRLFASATALGITITQGREEIAAATQEVLTANRLADARLRLTVTRGSLCRAMDDEPPQSTLLITASARQSYPPEFYQKGMLAIIAPCKQNPDDPLTGHKTLNYFSRILALQQAQKARAGEALWFTTTNRLAGACLSNVFLVKDGVLRTPSLDTPPMPGITRRTVLELAEKNTIPREEKQLIISDLLDADEVFLTNTAMELTPVCHIERHPVGDEKPGPVYKKLHELYRQTTDMC